MYSYEAFFYVVQSGLSLSLLRVRKFAAILLFLCISYQFVAKLGVIVWYQANIDYVAQELCENKDKPQMQCNGKCYLKKQLAKVDQQQQDEQQAPAKKIKSELPEFLATVTEINLTYHTDLSIVSYAIYKSHYKFEIVADIFHPPASVC